MWTILILFIVISIILFVMLSHAVNNLKPVAPAAVPAAIPTKSASVTLPVTVLPTVNGVSGQPTPAYPTTVTVNNASAFGDQIAAYGADYQEWIGPKGWTGGGIVGTDGSMSVNLANGSSYISYTTIPSCTDCILGDAAPYFSNAMTQYNTEAHAEPLVIPQGLTVTSLSSTLVTYTLPDSGGLLTYGVAYYIPGDTSINTSPYFAGAEFVLPQSETALANFLAQNFIAQQHLK